MRVETHDDMLLLEAREAFTAARDDVLAEAYRQARKYSKSGKFADSIVATDVTEADGRLTASVGSPLVSARAKERGAYIEAKAGKWLTFMGNEGHLVRVAAVRIPKQPAVVPAGRLFIDFMRARLKAARR